MFVFSSLNWGGETKVVKEEPRRKNSFLRLGQSVLACTLGIAVLCHPDSWDLDPDQDFENPDPGFLLYLDPFLFKTQSRKK
jgi:hypothetical protein